MLTSGSWDLGDKGSRRKITMSISLFSMERAHLLLSSQMARKKFMDT